MINTGKLWAFYYQRFCDRLSDIYAAKANNLTAIGCRFYFVQEVELAQADFVIEDLAELINLLPLLPI
ncbi:hypothetical protein [Planococcus halocryophilus]|uniref:hypothetical protein n=1 Tax=Planococcus halocryophilus TaxID=1215089 RepID=UPI003D33B8A1